MIKSLVGSLLTVFIGTLALADTQSPKSVVTPRGECTAEILKSLERDWSHAEQVGDRGKIGQILADDWTGVNTEGSKLTKEQLIARLNTGRVTTNSVELGPMEVKVLGDVAVVQGSVFEKSATNGTFSSGEMVWMDVFMKRDGKWVAVRSQSTRAAMTSRFRWPI
jgi:hypothetical protein